MARLDRATQPPRVRAANESYPRLDGPLLRAMTLTDSIYRLSAPDSALI